VLGHGALEALGRRTWELADYLVNGLGVKTWPGRYDAKVALHRSCHTRGTASIAAALTLLNAIDGVRVVEFGEVEQCCGFGGTFAVTFPHISTAMGALKLEHVRAAQPDVYVSVDMSCMMHLGGLAVKEGKPIKTMHVVQVLRDALRNG
jgi:L-lactate dehydrogenase complex protein LldE